MFNYEDFFEELRAQYSSEVPQAKKCATQKELADWFMQFARACHASLPKES